jgi:hypothetical protein
MQEAIIDLLNLIPGVEISFGHAAKNLAIAMQDEVDKLEPPKPIDFTFGVADGMNAIVGQMENELAKKLTDGTFDTASKFTKLVDDINEKAQAAAESAAAAAEAKSGAGIAPVPEEKRKKDKKQDANKGVDALQSGSASALKAIAAARQQGENRKDIMARQQTELLAKIYQGIASMAGDTRDKLKTLIDESRVATNVS